DLLRQLMAEPLAIVAAAVEDAATLPAEQRLRRILDGLVEAVMAHGGVAASVPTELHATDDPAPAGARPVPGPVELLARYAAGPDPELRARLVVGGVQSVLRDWVLRSESTADYEATVRRRHTELVEVALVGLVGTTRSAR
ncbi:MAG: hypothetical protein ACRCY9_16160, partial [Phycicoccus sp.]